MILPYIDFPEKLQKKAVGKKVTETFSREPNSGSITNDTFLYGGGMIDHPVLDFKFAAQNGNIMPAAAASLDSAGSDLVNGGFEEKYQMYSEKIEKERFARELLAGNG